VQSGVELRPLVLSVLESPRSARRLDPVELSEVEPLDVEPELLVPVRPIPIPEQALTDASTSDIANTEKYELRIISTPLR
jgi:hypothetical protein